MSGSAEIDAYVAALPAKQRTVMQQLRLIVTGAAPAAIEAIAYKMPALRLGDKFFMSYDAYKTHFSLFPSTDRMIELLNAFSE